MGQKFSSIEQVGTDLIDKEYDDNEQETSEIQSAGGFRNEDGSIYVEDECIWFYEPIKDESKFKKTYLCEKMWKKSLT